MNNKSAIHSEDSCDPGTQITSVMLGLGKLGCFDGRDSSEAPKVKTCVANKEDCNYAWKRLHMRCFYTEDRFLN